MNSANSQITINIPREDFVISLLSSNFDFNLDVIQTADPRIRYVDRNDKKTGIFGPIALFFVFK